MFVCLFVECFVYFVCFVCLVGCSFFLFRLLFACAVELWVFWLLVCLFHEGIVVCVCLVCLVVLLIAGLVGWLAG